MQSAAAKTAKATNAAVQHGEIHLYTYFRSSCSARLRIALALKGLPATYHYVNLLKGEQKQSSYASLNPSQSVPTLEVRFPEGGRSTIRIPQSIPALEYLDEAYPSSHPLLPPNLPENLQKRALIRTLCAVIASDTQPVTNLRILKRVRRLTTTSHPVDRNEVADTWGRELMLEGLRAYESICSEAGGGAAGDGTAGAAGDGEGMFSVGNEISMADVCLVPAVWGAQRLGVDLDQVPRVRRVFERLEKEDAVVRSHWRRQGDTPVELRG
jgi:maleylacetoacetate isomerase